jgi:hypothetical protein
MKYTKEMLEPLVCGSTSFGQVIDKLGMKRGGGTQANIIRRINQFGLSTSHFLGQGWSRGKAGKATPKLHFSEVLVKNRTGRREHADILRRALTEAGVPYVCENGHLPEWQSKPLVLEVDHKNGDNLDNRKDNLRFLCPNCHTQTDNFGSKNFATVVEWQTRTAQNRVG